MPITRGAIKKIRQDKKRTRINLLIKRKIKKTISQFKLSPSLKSLSQVFSMLDTAKKKKIYSPNKAARLKSRLSKLLVKKNPHSPQKSKTTSKKKT